MKEYVNTFMRYRFLLGELVKKGITTPSEVLSVTKVD